jgi:hypothetical protein
MLLVHVPKLSLQLPLDVLLTMPHAKNFFRTALDIPETSAIAR